LLRILNYIDIDCGPNGDCSDPVLKARKAFKGIFEAALIKARNITLNKDKSLKTEEKIKILSKKCSGTFDNTEKMNVICQASYFLFILGHENNPANFINEIEQNITRNLLETNFFKEMSSTRIKTQIVDKFFNYTSLNQFREPIKSSIANKTNQNQFNWTCSVTTCNESISSSFKLHNTLALLTSRVTKLGTLMVWSDSYKEVSAYLKEIYSKLGKGTSRIDVMDLAMALTPDGFNDQPKEDFNKFKTFDQRTNSCWPGVYFHQHFTSSFLCTKVFLKLFSTYRLSL